MVVFHSIVGMDADSRVEPGEALDEPEGTLRRGDVPARDEDPLDAGETRCARHEVDVVLEAIRVEVAVTVDERHGNLSGLCPGRL